MLISTVVLCFLAILSLIGIVKFNLPDIWLVAPAVMVALGYFTFVIGISRFNSKMADYFEKATHY